MRICVVPRGRRQAVGETPVFSERSGNMPMKKKIDLYRFTDARKYLSRCSRSKMPPWPISYGRLAHLLKTNKGYLWNALRGAKPFSNAIAEQMPRVLRLKDREALYLRVLLMLTHIDTDEKFRTAVIDRFRPSRYHRK
jgi:hypothetical protein